MAGSTGFKYKDIPLTGRLITSQDPSVIGENFQSLKNLRYKDVGLEGVRGSTKINTTALANVKITAGIHFKKSQPAESHTLIQAFDANTANPKIYDITAAIPTQGNGTLLYTEDTAASAGFFSLAPGEQVVFCDGKESLIWGGNEMRVAGFINYDETAATFTKDYSEQVTNTLTTTGNVAILTSTATECAYYLGCTRPIKGYKVYIGTANTAAAIIGTIYYWNSTAWTTVGTVTDGTQATQPSSPTHAQTGSITFANTKSVAKPKIINGVMLYWYKVVTSAALSVNTSITYVTVDASIQSIKNLWDGNPRPVSDGALFINTDESDITIKIAGKDYINESPIYAGATYAVIYNAYAAGTIGFYLGFTEPQCGLIVGMGTYEQKAVSNLIVDYWNGSAWTAVSGLVDGTSVGGKFFNKSGIITWSPVAKGTELKQIRNNEKELYYYRLTWSVTSSSGNSSYSVHVDYMAGIATTHDILPHQFPVFAQNRLWLCDELADKRNTARCSATYTTEVWDGEDTSTFELGDGKPVKAGHELRFFTSEGAKSMVLFSKIGESYSVLGNTPADWEQDTVSDNVGCVAPRTMQALNITIPDSQTSNKQVLFWQSYYGIHLFDGTSPVLISHDISNYFDRSKSECITATKVWDSSAFVDTNNQEYHWLFYSGTGATPKELVYDFKRHKWFEIVRN